MAIDIANIGFGVDTSDLEKGVATLHTFSTSAKKASSNAQMIGSSMNSAAKTFAGAAAGFSRSVTALVSASKGATKEQIKASQEASEFSDRVYRAAQAQEKLASSVNKASNAVKHQSKVLRTSLTIQEAMAKNSHKLSGESAKDAYMAFRYGMSNKDFSEAIGMPRDTMPNRFNTANVAAQFQDIAVTASMGMNPMLVAIQQGTQLSAILNSMENPAKGLAEAFKQIINPTSLMSIAFTALVVSLIQLVDWLKVAKSSLQALASGIDAVASGFEYLADKSDVLLVALGALGAGFAIFKSGAIIESFRTLGSSIKDMGDKIRDAGKKAKTFMKDFVKGLNPATLKIIALTGGVVLLYMAFKKFRKEITGFFETKLGQGIKSVVNAMIGSFTAGFEAIYAGATWLWEKMKSLWSESDGPVDGLMERMDKAIERATTRDYTGKIADGISTVSNVVNDFAKGTFSEVSGLFKSGADSIRKFSDSLGESSDAAKKAADAWEKLKRSARETIEGLKLDNSLVGRSTYDVTFYKTQQDLTNQAINNGVTLDESKRGQINSFADEIATLTERNEKLTESFDFSKSSVNSFFQDMRQGLWEGQSLWESFGNAVTNVLDRILSKIVDVGVDLLFQGFSQAGMFGGGGGSTGWNPATTPPPVKPVMNAKGGAYTNGIYSSPTLFKFANGGKFGMMGEAGPEAVMPLRRAPDGSLGVASDSSNSGNNVFVNVVNNSDSQASVQQKETSQGTEIDVIIDKMVAGKISQPGSSSNTALTAFNNRRLIAR